MAKVSVVIPVYNVENYLRQCIDSVIGQTLTDIEIICVDDGSTDASPQILDEYAASDSRVRVIHQSNCHVSATRNHGLAVATGEYIIFWDSDDYFALDALEKMYNKAIEHDADICICDAQDFDNETNNNLAHNYINKPFPEEEVFNIQTYKERFFTFTAPVPWNKLIRRNLLIQENISFSTDFKVVEDVVPMFMALACAKRVVLYHEKLIFYRINRKESLTSNYEDNILSVFDAYEQLKKELDCRDLLEDPSILRSFQNKALAIYLYVMKYCNTFEQFKKYYKDLVREKIHNLGLDEIPDGYLYSLNNEVKYNNISKMESEEYIFWQFKELNRINAEQRQKISDCKNKYSKLKKSDEIKIKKLKAQIDEKKDITKDLEERLERQKKELDKLKNSRTYKVGKIIVWLPGKIKRLFK